MFDFGMTELMVIGAVALVVLGPEKLPVVARTAGEWIGKAQRLVAQVKGDIEREAELSELKKIQEEAKSVADDITKTVKGEADAIEGEMKSLENDVNAVAKSAEADFESTTPRPSPNTRNCPTPNPIPRLPTSGKRRLRRRTISTVGTGTIRPIIPLRTSLRSATNPAPA